MTRRWLETFVGALCCVVYLGVSQGLGEEYPFSPLSMFSGGETSSGRIVVRAADGLHALRDFSGFSCEGPFDMTSIGQPSCSHIGPHIERDQDAVDYVHAHRGKAGVGEPVTIGRLWFRVARSRGSIEQGFCPLVRCLARRP